MTAIVRRYPALLCVTLAVPLVALLVAMHRERWFPSGDLAQAELHVRGFFRNPPLVGAAGRIGTIEQQGSHPGPAMWVALLPTYLLFARSAYGLMVAMVVLQTVSVVAAVGLARRIGGVALAIAAVQSFPSLPVARTGRISPARLWRCGLGNGGKQKSSFGRIRVPSGWSTATIVAWSR